MLMVTKVGGPLLPTLDGEYCRIYTREGKVYTGTVLSLSPSVHVQDDAATRPRDEKNMAVRIDEKVHNKEDVLALGIAAGDYDDLCRKWGRDNALAAILNTIAHELTHYFQWINSLQLTPIGEERQAARYAGYILDEYAETREHP